MLTYIKSWIRNVLLPWAIENIAGHLTPGHFLYTVLQRFYIKSFETLSRQSNDCQGDQYDWENPEVVSRMRRKMSCSSRSFQTSAHAVRFWKIDYATRKYDTQENGQFMLTGKCGEVDQLHPWLFLLVSDPNSCPANWELLSNTEQSKWSNVTLPNHWQLQGFDVPLYTNTGYPFAFDPPRTRRNGQWVNTACDVGCGGTSVTGLQYLHPNEPGENATGLFQRRFRLSDEWSGEDGRWSAEHDRVFLVFAGVDSCVSVWVNGVFAGFSKDSCLSAEFDVTDALRGAGDEWLSAEHRIAVQVSRWCDGSYLEDQDKWWLSGIYREAYLERRPSSFVSDFEFCSDVRSLSGAGSHGATADLRVLVELECSSPAVAARCAVRAELHQIADKSECSSPALVLVSGVAAGALSDMSAARGAAEALCCDAVNVDCPLTGHRAVATLASTLSGVSLWTAETPSLYALVISLHATAEDAASGDRALHVVSSRVGFRKVSVGGPDNVLRINEQLLTVAGVNRHEFDPATGRAVSEESMRRDAVLLKQLNFNAVRCSHYPQHPYWLELCDELGLYVVDEANIETHGFQLLGQPVGYLASLPQWRGAMASRLVRMVERDKNHACVIGWSLGNESGFGPTHDAMADWLRIRDPGRFVQYESGGALTSATDIICPMYQRLDWCRQQASSDAQRRPLILCEYAHAMGNSGGCLAQYWAAFRDPRLPRLQGGFIWDFVDQGLLMPPPLGADPDARCFGYGGDFGDWPNTKQFCCNGIVGPDRDLHPSAIEAAFLQAPIQLSLVAALDCEDSGQPLRLRIKSRREHSDLSDLCVVLTPCASSGEVGDVVKCASFEIRLRDHNVPAGAEVEIDISLLLSEALRTSPSVSSHLASLTGVTGWLDVSVVRSEQCLWAPQGFEVTHTALQSPALLRAMCDMLAVSERSETSGTAGAVSFSEGMASDGLTKVVTVLWANGASATVDHGSGLLVSWSDSSQYELLVGALEVCLFRAGTDNDKGGTVLSYYARWREAGLDQLQQNTDEKPIALDSCVADPDGSVRMTCTWNLRNAAAKNVASCSLQYCFTTAGNIEVRSSVIPDASLPPLPRCGLRFAVERGFEEARWMGLGPHEAYADRRESAYWGSFRLPVQDLHSRYVVPQECGRRAEPRWVLLVNKSRACGLAMVPEGGGAGYGFSASKFSVETLDRTMHEHDLVPAADERVHVHLDGFCMGVGGYDSWSPNVDRQFRVDPATDRQALETCVTLMAVADVQE